jgi:transcription initiation factor TFIID subunit TAF12
LIDVFRTLSRAWHAFLGFGAPLIEQPSKRKREQQQQQQQQQQQKRAKVVPTDHMEAATPSLSLPCQEASSREASLEVSLEAAVRTVLSMLAD